MRRFLGKAAIHRRFPCGMNPDPRLINYSQGTFSRDSEASFFYEDSATLQWWPSGSLRETTLTAPNGLKYFVFEGPRTNYITGSERSTPGSALVHSTGSAPDGESDAQQWSMTLNQTAHREITGVVFQSGTIQSTVFMKPVSGDLTYRHLIRDHNNNSTSADQALSSSWTRYYNRDTNTASGSFTIRTFAQKLVDAGSAYVWGWQIESGSFPSSYIRTDGAAGTRVADNLTFPTNGLPGDYSIYLKPFFNSDQLKTDGITYNVFGRGNDGSGANAGLAFRGVAGTARVAIFAPNGGVQSGIDVTCTFSAHQQLKITVKASTGQIVLEGFTTGNGTWGNGTPWTWPNATLYVARFASGFTRNFFGLMTEPFAP